MSILGTSYSIVGDCGNTSAGTFSLSYTASSPPVSVTWINPVSGISFSSGTITTNPYVVTGLSAGYYSLQIYDTPYLGETVYQVPISFVITSSITITLTTSVNTTCGDNNGTVYAYMPINYGLNTVSLYSSGGFYTSASTNSNYVYFQGLAPDVYYVVVQDLGGCEGISNSVIVKTSTPLDFNLYTVNNPACVIQNGQIYITSVSGAAPFTYVWDNSISPTVTGTSVTGLSIGNYGVTVTDSLGCSSFKSTTVSASSSLSVLAYTTVLPDCYSNNGQITFYTSGGSAPFNYSLSNGVSQTLISNEVTFTGLSSGVYDLTITDAGLCQTNYEAQLFAPNSFSIISSTKEDSYCDKRGSITTQLQDGTPPFLFTLSASSGSVTKRTTSLATNTFSNLNYGNYLLTVRDINSACTYNEIITIENFTNFSISLTANTDNCASFSGSINVGINQVYQTGLTYTYYLSSGQRSSPTTATTYTFTGLPSAFYTATVIDDTACTITGITFIPKTEPYQLFLYSTSCQNGNEGTVTALIQETDGPYSLFWSENVNGQTGIFITGLTAGTYTLTVSGENNCITSRSIDVTCDPKQITSYSFKYSKGVKETIPTTKLTLKNMMYSGYTSLVENSTNCTLSGATFNFKVNIGGIDYEFPFYYTESFDNIPDLSYFAPIIQSSILTIPNIQSCTVDAEKNSINILAKADQTGEYYKGETITFTIRIYYVIKCISVNNIICV
jgi:hypothetical protein